MHKHHLLHLTVHSSLKLPRLLRHEDLLLDQKFQLSEILSLQETVEILRGGNALVQTAQTPLGCDGCCPGGSNTSRQGPMQGEMTPGQGSRVPRGAGGTRAPTCLGVTKQGGNHVGCTLHAEKCTASFKRVENPAVSSVVKDSKSGK